MLKALVFLEKSLPILFWGLLSFTFDQPEVAILTGIATVIHESGHALCILKLCGYPTIINKISGPKLKISSTSYKDELWIALCGPLANLTFALLTITPFLITNSFYLLEFILINALTAIFNLIPIFGFDGFKILYAIFSLSKNSERLLTVLYHASLAITATLTLFSLFFVLRIGEGYWIFALFFSILLSEIAKWQKRTF